LDALRHSLVVRLLADVAPTWDCEAIPTFAASFFAVRAGLDFSPEALHAVD